MIFDKLNTIIYEQLEDFFEKAGAGLQTRLYQCGLSVDFSKLQFEKEIVVPRGNCKIILKKALIIRVGFMPAKPGFRKLKFAATNAGFRIILQVAP